MKENKNVQSVFRFVTVRSPQKRSTMASLIAMAVRKDAATAFHTSLIAAQAVDDMEQRFATMAAD